MSDILNYRMLKFGAVGLSGMIIDFLVTWICKERLQINRFLSNSLGFTLAVVNNFLLNRYITFFNQHQPMTAQFIKFVLVSICGLIINNFFLYLLLKIVKTNFYVVKLVVIGIVFFWNYFANFLFTFQ